MSKFIKYDTTLTDVTSFSANYDNRSLSAAPQFTNTHTTLTCGFSARETFEGYNFNSLEGVMLSTVGGADLAGLAAIGISLTTTVTALSYLSGGATIDPPLTGFFLTPTTTAGLAGTYILNNYNSMSVAFPTMSAIGVIDVIPINAAGFTALITDIQTTITIS